jgi:SET domain-containing protein
MLPHDKVFTRLGVSKIHGIGVFAIADIEKDTPLFAYDNTEVVWITASELAGISENQKKFYEDFCIIKNGGNLYGCPPNFNQLTMAWYMNHSDSPNVEVDEDYNFRTQVKIKDGEELTIDYNTFSD